MTKDEIKATMQNDMYEVYPVIDRTFDDVKGVVLLKDIVFKLDDDDFSLANVLTPAEYFHENQNVYKVLERLKERRISQALICDEFGSCQGIITLKDILGGLVGTIEDKQSEPDIVKHPDNSGWLIDGQCSVYDFLSYFEREELYDADSDYNTLGGLVLELLEHIPHKGEKVEWHDFVLEVVNMDGVRIDLISVTMQKNDSDNKQ